MIHLTYECLLPNAFLPYIHNAALVWNKILEGHVMLHYQDDADYLSANIIIRHGWTPTADNPNCVADCTRTGPDRWLIRFDSSRTKWATSWWRKFLGVGENPRAAAIHEFGHVFGIPHAEEKTYAMHKEIGGFGHPDAFELLLYRQQFLDGQIEAD